MIPNVFFEALGIATGLGAIAVNPNAFPLTECAPSPTDVPVLRDHHAEVAAAADQSRAKLRTHARYSIAAWLSATAVTSGVAVTHVDDPLVMVVTTLCAACFLVGGQTVLIRVLLALRCSRAREAFDRSYVGRYESFDSALARFARENPKAYRIAHRSLVADEKADWVERERQAQAYAEALHRALA